MDILIIGGTGTLGKAALSELGTNHRITVLSREELKQKQLKAVYPHVKFVLGDVREGSSLSKHFIGKDVVFHFAAMKHVDMAEENPEESIKINLLGSLNVANAAIAAGVPYCAFSSTDKAVLPVNNYGMCKALSEQYYLHLNTEQKITKFSVFRWGNVFGSRGSVIHSFLASLKADKKVYITDPKMTRFWIDIADAAKFIIENYKDAPIDRVMIPQMKAARLLKIAELCARHLGTQFSIVYSGIRPGEKIHETIFSSHDFCIRSDNYPEYDDEEILDMIARVVE